MGIQSASDATRVEVNKKFFHLKATTACSTEAIINKFPEHHFCTCPQTKAAMCHRGAMKGKIEAQTNNRHQFPPSSFSAQFELNFHFARTR
jgi:hypothetical protein